MSKTYSLRVLTASLVVPTASLTIASSALAQNVIVPDATLGAESSQVIPRDATTDLIEGGAIRDANLFHSFQDFNVGEGLQVYFNNPTGIDNILSRVTGGNPSDIFGTLGVEGPANLFFLNPNGIMFGPEASLDVEGSFLATTAEGVRFSGGDIFSTNNAASTSVLSIGVPLGLQYGTNATAATIENTASLTSGQDLTLAADNLDLQGQIQAGENLTLQATDTLKIRDTAELAFVAAAGEQLLVQGDESVDIFALNNSQSGLFSGGDMTLRSANPVGGDAHYWSGGSFRSENLDGTIGDLYSPYDPIIRSAGNVVIGEYEGTSLHILAGGSVEIETATITGVEQGAVGVDFLQETVTLSDGTVVEIDGAARPTLDVRAGVDPAVLGTPPIDVLTGNASTDTFSNNGPDTFAALNADITIGDAVVDYQPGEASNGLVLLTNQYRPNSENTAGNILINGEGEYELGIDVSNEFGDSRGDIFIDSRGDVSVVASGLATAAAGEAGDITVLAQETVRFDSLDRNGNFVPGGAVSGVINLEGLEGSQELAALLTLPEASVIERLNVLESIDVIEGRAGNIRISAENLELLNGVLLNADTILGTGDAGNITLDVEDTIRFSGIGFDDIDNRNVSSFISSSTVKGGSAGNISLTANTVEVLDGSAILAFSVASDNNAGSITIDAQESVLLSGGRIVRSNDQVVFNGLLNGSVGGENSRGGDINISARTLEVDNGFQINTVSGLDGGIDGGRAGNISIDVSETARLNGAGTGATTTLRFSDGGTGGDINIAANNLEVTNGAVLVSGTEFSSGNAGNITLDVEETVTLDGFSDVNPANVPVGGIFSGTALGTEGTGGTINISARNLGVTNGSTISSSTTFADGDAGDILIAVSETVELSGTTTEKPIVLGGIDIDIGTTIPGGISSEIVAAEGATGNGGDIRVSADDLILSEGGSLDASSLGEAGNAGNIVLTIQEQLTANDGMIETASINTSGGQINIAARDISLFGDSDIVTIVGQGEGGGGNITITADSVNAFGDSDILAFARDGKGGDVTLNTPAFFGENYQPAPAGTDPLTLDGNGRVDVNADGAIAGNIDVPDVSFIQDNLTELPDNIVNTNQLIAGSCIARQGESGSFVVSGGGGLPDRPGRGAIAPYPIGEIRRLQGSTANAQPNLTEPQGVFQLVDGRLIMSRSCEG
ncbi:MAG: filamentous hemagglutinin N-terminal domain-containing protein [Cyanobacteria bacterium P01_A01_bin.116]